MVGFGDSEFGSDAYGSELDAFGVESAVATSVNRVSVRFTTLLDFSFPATLNPANYNLSPSLTVLSVVQESARSVILFTTTQSVVPYVVTVIQAQSLDGILLDPELDQATFGGFEPNPTFFAVATAKRRVRALFQEAMLNDPELVTPANYVVTDLQGAAVSVIGVAKEQSTGPIYSVVLTLGQDLVEDQLYQVTISANIHTQNGQIISPATSLFQWIAGTPRLSIPISAFSGEVQEGLYGIHGGLVFFSPALETPAANSIIQIEDVDVCTKAFDEYHFPVLLDPIPLYTHGADIVPTPNPTLLNQSVLWAPFPRLVEARFVVTFKPVDAMPQAADGPATATLREPWDEDYVSLLNNTHWKLFDNAGEPPVYFKTADNLAPIPPGPVVVIVLQP